MLIQLYKCNELIICWCFLSDNWCSCSISMLPCCVLLKSQKIVEWLWHFFIREMQIQLKSYNQNHKVCAFFSRRLYKHIARQYKRIVYSEESFLFPNAKTKLKTFCHSRYGWALFSKQYHFENERLSKMWFILRSLHFISSVALFVW